MLYYNITPTPLTETMRSCFLTARAVWSRFHSWMGPSPTSVVNNSNNTNTTNN